MRDTQSLKTSLIIPPQVVKNASVTGKINTSGYSTALLLVSLGAMDVNLTALKVEASDDDVTYTQIPGAEYGATNAPALPVAADANNHFAFDINLEAKAKWLKVTVTAPNGTNGALVSVSGILDRYSGQVPDSAAGRGLKNVIRV